MKKIFKNPIFMFVLGGLIFGGLGIGVYAISASEITYNNATVADAIDGLYQINSYQTDYSTEEKVVGTWTDGRPVYQKTLNIGALTNSTNAWSSKLVDTGVSISEIVNMSVIMIDNTNVVIEGSYHDGGSTVTFNIGYPNSHTNASNRNKVGIRYAGDLSWITDSYVTVQYTKTTDTVPNQNQEG